MKQRCVLWLMGHLCLLGGVAPKGWAQGPAEGGPPRMLQVDVPAGHLVGLPVHWSRLDAVVLEPTGQLHVIDQREVRGHRLLPDAFAPQTQADARQLLQAELGPRYETLVCGPYVIAAPLGHAERWRERFQALLAGYLRYFEVRGWQLRRPDFPLCVIVFATRQEFLAYASTQVSHLPSSLVGSYFPRSNRCVLYHIDDAPSANAEGAVKTNWAETEATIVHEAVHQLAYNTGIHERLSMDPLWLVEGLASMFEQPNVYDLRQQQSTLASRMLPDKRQRLQPLLQQPEELLRKLQSLIATDELFRNDPTLAYDLAWGLTFYLAERMPNEFRRYAARLAARPLGEPSLGQRIGDFQAEFGGDLSLLAVQLSRLLLK